MRSPKQRVEGRAGSLRREFEEASVNCFREIEVLSTMYVRCAQCELEEARGRSLGVGPFHIISP